MEADDELYLPFGVSGFLALWAYYAVIEG